MTKQQAIELITPVIDNEATPAERDALFAYMQRDAHVLQIYQSERKIKNILSKSCKRVPAPAHLRSFVRKLPDYYGAVDIPDDESLTFQNITSLRPNQSNITFYFTLVAVLLLTYLVFSNRFSPEPAYADVFVESVSLEHFYQLNHTDNFSIDFSGISIPEAENLIKKHYGRQITVPELDGVQFHGITMATFSGNYITPLFTYFDASQNNHILVFGFDLDDMAPYLHINEEAQKSCRSKNDYHITKIDGHDIVSWRWGNNWYTTVSKFDGNTIASMVASLQ